MQSLRLYFLLMLIPCFMLIPCTGCDRDHRAAGHEAHEPHGSKAACAHDEKTAGVHAGEAGHEHADESEEHAAHGEEQEIALTPEAIAMADITLAVAETGRIRRTLSLSGEIGFNEDKLVRMTPRFSGIVKEARFGIGDRVRAGDVMAVIESDESMASYTLTAPMTGQVIEKHLLPGEHVSDEQSVYLLADLTTVWVTLAVYPGDASKVRVGQKAVVNQVGDETTAEGVVRYLAPVMDARTRRITARVVLANPDNHWRPGAFVTARIEAGDGAEGVTVEKDAIQMLDNKTVVFVSDEPNRFIPAPVLTGDSDARHVLILAGLEAGTSYVNKGAFEIKAKIVTGALGGHAGHGH